MTGRWWAVRALLCLGVVACGLTRAQTAELALHARHALVLDAGQDLQALPTIEEADLDTLKHTRGGVPVGVTLPRGKLLELALTACDNHAASSLARHYPGGMRCCSTRAPGPAAPWTPRT
jgi:hypothetical protein